MRVSASGEYSEVRTGRETFLVQIPLRELLACLDPDTFEQVHRSHIVNLNAVEHLRPTDDRRLVTLRDGAEILRAARPPNEFDGAFADAGALASPTPQRLMPARRSRRIGSPCESPFERRP